MRFKLKLIVLRHPGDVQAGRMTEGRIMPAKIARAIGLSNAYRALWALEQDNRQPFAALQAPAILDRLDDESRELLALSCRLAPYVADQFLGPFLHLDECAARRLLPDSTRKALTAFGYFNDPKKSSGQLATGAASDADETLSHYGLKYLADRARADLANRDVIDAGSFDGTSAKFFLEEYPVARVFCFEPDPENYVLLDENTGSEQADQTLIATNMALSDRNGVARMSPAGVGSSRSKAALPSQPAITIKTVTLDRFLKGYEDANIGLIKLDVEGDAVPALSGAMKTIHRHQPILIVSFYHTPDEFAATPPLLMESLPGYDFMIRKVTPNLFKEHVIIGTPKTH